MNLKEILINWLNKKALNNGTPVELSIGTVYIKQVTNGIANKCRAKSCVINDFMNNALFFNLIEYELTNLSKKQIDALSISDGDKLRNTIRNILLKQNVLKVEGTSPDSEFSAEDIQVLDKQKKAHKNIMNKMREGGQVPAHEVIPNV